MTNVSHGTFTDCRYDAQKWGFFCKVQRRPPADIFSNESLPPKTPLRTPCSWPPWPWFSRENVEDFQSFVKNTKLWLSLWKSVSCKNMRLKSSHWFCLKVCLKGYTFCFTTFLDSPSTGAQQSHERTPKNVQMSLKDQSFVDKFKVSFVCTPEDAWPSNFGKCLKMPQR